MRNSKVFVTSFLFIILAADPAWAFGEGSLFGMERRRDQFSHDFGYFLYPISGSVPGLGTAYGGGATVTNISETDVDFTGFYITGDFSASGAAVLNYHLIENRLILDVANYTAKVAPKQYNRGMDSKKDDFILPKVESEMTVSQLTYTVFDRMFEFYLRGGLGSQRLLKVYDSEGNEFSNTDKSRTYFQGLTIGFGLDVTDDRQDPRRGVRYEMKERMIFAEYGDSSAFDVLDANLTYYHPVGESSTWVFNAFYSTALMRKKGLTDRETLRQNQGLQCQNIPDPAGRAECDKAEAAFLDEMIANNTYGNATELGGVTRLRSFPMGRYHAGQAVGYGTELRWNLTDENTPMDWYILRGLRTAIQVAFFADAGSVADKSGDLHNKILTSVGTGVRILFSGVTIRFDVATGSEGTEGQLMLDYPYSMFTVASVM